MVNQHGKPKMDRTGTILDHCSWRLEVYHDISEYFYIRSYIYCGSSEKWSLHNGLYLRILETFEWDRNGIFKWWPAQVFLHFGHQFAFSGHSQHTTLQFQMSSSRHSRRRAVESGRVGKRGNAELRNILVLSKVWKIDFCCYASLTYFYVYIIIYFSKETSIFGSKLNNY